MRFALWCCRAAINGAAIGHRALFPAIDAIKTATRPLTLTFTSEASPIVLPPRALAHAVAVLHGPRLQTPGDSDAKVSDLPGSDDYEKIASAKLLARHGLVALATTVDAGLGAGKEEL